MTTVVGIDLGGTKVAAAVLDADGLRQSVLRPTELSSTDALIEQLVSIVAEVRGEEAIDAVGIGVPSIVRFDTGMVVSSVNIPLADVPLRSVLGERLGVPVFVDNDATVAALAEAHDEQLRLVAQNLVMLTIGTGVGGGIVLGGRIFRGATGGGGELGHTLIGLAVGNDVPFASDRFPQPGSLEALASGHALDKLATAVSEQDPDSKLGVLANTQKVRGPEAVDAARSGDAAAEAIVRRWAHAIGIGVANAINTFDPDEVVIGGGGGSAAGDLILGPAREIAEGYTLPGLRGHATVRLARFGPRAGVVGASLLAVHELDATAAKLPAR